jgi:hypothetical protein
MQDARGNLAPARNQGCTASDGFVARRRAVAAQCASTIGRALTFVLCAPHQTGIRVAF